MSQFKIKPKTSPSCKTLVLKLSVLTALITSTSVIAAIPTDTSTLRAAVTSQGIIDHLNELQIIANSNNGTRASGSSGYAKSVDYIQSKLSSDYYTITRQTFSFLKFSEPTPSELNRVSPNPVNYGHDIDFHTMSYSGAGDVTGTIVKAGGIIIPPTATTSSTSGCLPTDFVPASTTEMQISLVQRGGCTFATKAKNAAAAGYDGIIIFNEGTTAGMGLIRGTLGAQNAITIPVIGTTYALGHELYNLSLQGPVVVHMNVTATITKTQSQNLIAETKKGRDDRVVVVGAHLDSVESAPGINDNGSGSATTLEVAIQMANLGIEPKNKVRFTWWGAEEDGLIGSAYYVNGLSKTQIRNIALYLNFDMVGSPNFIRSVYTGVGNPKGSDVITGVFTSYFESIGMTYQVPARDIGRSDHTSFAGIGIPVGGLDAGYDQIKTHAEFLLFGGTEGAPMDPCYHQACDTITNINETVINDLADAMAHTVLTFAQTTSAVNGTEKGVANGRTGDYLGSHLIK